MSKSAGLEGLFSNKINRRYSKNFEIKKSNIEYFNI